MDTEGTGLGRIQDQDRVQGQDLDDEIDTIDIDDVQRAEAVVVVEHVVTVVAGEIIDINEAVEIDPEVETVVREAVHARPTRDRDRGRGLVPVIEIVVLRTVDAAIPEAEIESRHRQMRCHL